MSKARRKCRVLVDEPTFKVESHDHQSFTAAEIADYAGEHDESAPVRIFSHGESYGIGGMSWDPDSGEIVLLGDCDGDWPCSPEALSIPGDEVATAAGRAGMAEKLAQHLEAVAARVRRKYPKGTSQ